jgi:hypothetical protein
VLFLVGVVVIEGEGDFSVVIFVDYGAGFVDSGTSGALPFELVVLAVFVVLVVGGSVFVAFVADSRFH